MRLRMILLLLLSTLLGALAGAVFAQLPAPGQPGAPKDSRYCGEPQRDASGRIKRSERVLNEYVRIWTCPANDLPVYGLKCPNWQLNHVLPLSRGGCDLKHNLTWQRVEVKVCRKDAPYNTDCTERHVYDPRRPGERW